MLSYGYKQEKDFLNISLKGKCQAIFLKEIEKSFLLDLKEHATGTQTIKLDLKDLEEFDTTGAWFLITTTQSLEKSGKNVQLNCTDIQKKQIDSLKKISSKDFTIKKSKDSLKGMDKFLSDLGKGAIENYGFINELLTFFGETLVTLKDMVKFRAVRWTSICHHIEAVGLQAIPIVGLISFLIGSVLAYQGINQLAHFGAQIYAVDFLSISILREIAVLITSIVIAGRSGSSFAAQIGTMALNQEIDAIRVLGLKPMVVLVIPRMIALFICLPILVFFSMIMGLMGGMLLCFLVIDLAPLQFWISFKKAISVSTFFVGLIKAPLFAMLISLVGCYRGMQVKDSAESVGFMTTRAVVESIFLVIVFDALLSILFSALDI